MFVPYLGSRGVIRAGSSVADTNSGFQSMDYSVKYKVEIENFSDQPLELVRSEIHSGYLNNPPPPVIMPGMDFLIYGRNCYI